MDAWPIDGELTGYRSVPSDPRAAVLIVHGFGEHAARHATIMHAFARRGVAAYAYDQRGHGRSPGRRAFVAHFDDLVDDAMAMRARVAACHPGLPLVLAGVSMGGVVVARSVMRDARGLAGVLLISPAFAVTGSSPFLRALATVVGTVAPATPVAQLELAALCRDPAVVAAYVADPLNYHGRVPARTAVEILRAGKAALAAAPAWQLPTFLIHGEADRIAAPAGTQQFAAAAREADVTFKLVPGAYHEPFNDPNGAALLDEVVDWVRALELPAAHRALDQRGASQARRRVYTWREGLAFGVAVNGLARLLGTNTGRYETIARPAFAPPGWVFPVAWGVNSALAIWGNLRVLNAAPSHDRTAYLRLWAATWLLYVSFGYAFFRRKSPLLGLLVTTNFLTLAVLSFGRARRIDRRLTLCYVTLLPWLGLATAIAGSVALTNPDPLLDPPQE